MTDRFRCLRDVSYRERERYHEQREYRATPKGIHVRNEDRLIQDGLTDPSNGLLLRGYQRRALGYEELRYTIKGVFIVGR